MKIKIYILFFCLMMPFGLRAQDIVVVGKVMNEDSVGLAAADVWFGGTRLGTSTNEDGIFYLRSPYPQKTLHVSVIGYKSKKIKLNYGHDEMIVVMLEEDVSLLDEIVLLPNNNQAIDIMRGVYENREHNAMTQYSDLTTQVNMTDIPERVLRKKLFKGLENGVIDRSDSTVSLPAYYSESKDGAIVSENWLPVMERDQWRNVVNAYVPDVNIYEPYVTILGSNFASPVMKSPQMYYNLYLTDSTIIDSDKLYKIKFKPKGTNGLYLEGFLDVDSATKRITGIDITTSKYSNVNLLNRYRLVMNDSTKQESLAMEINPFNFESTRLFGAMGFVNGTNGIISERDSTRREQVNQSLDSIKDNKLVKVVYWAFDFAMTQMFHAGPIDIGPLGNLFHYNQIDGATPMLELHTNHKCPGLNGKAGHFMIGGYYGYAHKMKEHLYGGSLQWMSKNRKHIVGVLYDHKTFAYGYDDQYIFVENAVVDAMNMYNSLSQINKVRMITELGTRETIRYIYQDKFGKTSFKFRADLEHSRYVATEGALYPLHKGGIMLKSDFRLSWEEKYLERYFSNYYLQSKYPVIHLFAEIGAVEHGIPDVGTKYSPAVRLGVYAHQAALVGFDKLMWSTRLIFNSQGEYMRTSRSWWHACDDMVILDPYELGGLALWSATLRWQTHGYLFGWIPGVKKLGIKEDVYAGIALSEMCKVPHVEAGFGFSNLLGMFKIQFMWKCTNRDFGEKFAFRWGVEF